MSTNANNGSAALTPDARKGLELIREAGERTLYWYRRDNLEVSVKTDGSPVTQADRDVETWLRAALRELFPDDGIYGEEFPEHIGTSGRRWVIDPIDGTKSFIRHVPLFGNLLALEVDGRSEAGFINLPVSGETVYAERGRGTWWDEDRAHVSDVETLDGAYVLSTWLEDWPGVVLDEFKDRGAIVRGWGDAFGYAMVATGRAEAIADFGAGLYDLAPMPVILEEAGGAFSDADGSAAHDRGTGIASNGRVHDRVKEILARR